MASTIHRDERALIEACIDGQPESWERFVERYRRLVRSTIGRMCSRALQRGLDQEDLEAHVYEKLLEDRCRRLRLWKGRARFSTYLVQVTRNLCLDYLAKGGTAPIVESFDEKHDYPDPEPPPAFDSVEFRALRLEALREAIEALPDRQALIMQLRLEGKSLREIARMLNRPVGTVSVENSRAMAKLREFIRRKRPDLEIPASEDEEK